jgi:hypothetical protein
MQWNTRSIYSLTFSHFLLPLLLSSKPLKSSFIIAFWFVYRKSRQKGLASWRLRKIVNWDSKVTLEAWSWLWWTLDGRSTSSYYGLTSRDALYEQNLLSFQILLLTSPPGLFRNSLVRHLACGVHDVFIPVFITWRIMNTNRRITPLRDLKVVV